MSKSTQESEPTTQEPPTESNQINVQESNQINVQESEHIPHDYHNNINNFFDAWEDYLHQYRQSVENLQLEWTRSCKAMFNSTISTQQEIAKRYGVNYSIPEATHKIIEDSIDSATKLTQEQSKTMSDSFATTRNNIKAFNENTKHFVKMGHSITDLCNPSGYKNQ
ncbi:MAG: hypothetical protein COA77_01210 [Thaumarchaeota archaeon]|nr:MAG: hypothetical protein COA77_01210 [Nitrososphaerota archaeon]